MRGALTPENVLINVTCSHCFADIMGHARTSNPGIAMNSWIGPARHHLALGPSRVGPILQGGRKQQRGPAKELQNHKGNASGYLRF